MSIESGCGADFITANHVVDGDPGTMEDALPSF